MKWLNSKSANLSAAKTHATTSQPIKRTVLLLGGLSLLMTLSGCETTSDYFRVADKQSNCSTAILFYRHAVSSSTKSKDDADVYRAVSGIKSRLPSCEYNPENVVAEASFVTELLYGRGYKSEALDITKVATTYMEGHPAAYFGPRLFEKGTDSASSPFIRAASTANDKDLLDRLDRISSGRASWSQQQVESRERQSHAARLQASDDYVRGSSSSGIVAMTGAIAQGLAASGGKNAAQVQALGSAMQAGGATPAPYAAPRNVTPASAGTGAQSVSPKSAAALASGNNGASARDPFKYSANVNECLVTEPNPGMAGTDQWRNACSFKINITYCRITADRNDCAKQLLGAESLPAGGTTYLLRGRQTHHYVVCKEPFYLPSTRVTWNGERFSGKCQASS